MCLPNPIPCGLSSTLTYCPNGKWMGQLSTHTCPLHLHTGAFLAQVSLVFDRFCGNLTPPRTIYAPKACVCPTQFLVACHQPSHIVPMANGWANFLPIHAHFTSTRVLFWLRSVSFLTVFGGI